MTGRTGVRIEDLWVDLDEFHLHEIELDIAPGEYFVILGPTGAGKTVLLEAIAGLHQLGRGRILLNGGDVTRVPPERRGIGFVYQDYMLFPHLCVRDNVAFGLRARGADRAVIAERVVEIGRLLGISHLLHRRPGTLSGGEQQRVALARALVVRPRLLLLDEPLSALDPEMREGLQRELARLHRELGTTTIHVTHDFQEAVALGDRIAVVNEGRVVQVGSSEEVFYRPNSEFVARFVGVRNIFRGEVVAGVGGEGVLHAGGMEVAVATDVVGTVHGAIRPEDIVLSREPLCSGAGNAFRGRVVSVVDRGTVVYVTVRVPPDFVCAITRRARKEMGLEEGQEVCIAFGASAVHVF